MKKILLISDTHGLIADDVLEWMDKVDEIWHAGDLGEGNVLDTLEAAKKPLRIVWGNIDGQKYRNEFEEHLFFELEGVKVYITHIGGYPPNYNKRSRPHILDKRPDLYICGHSHICKVMPDPSKKLLHINPGACGIIGFHKFRTIVYLELDNGKIANLKVIELGKRSDINNI